MNRPIKFRAWDGKRMVVGAQPKVWAVGFDGYIRVVEDGVVSLPEVELMQFTGLLDKNGKEIYEGDILKWDDKSPIRVVKNTISEVRWGIPQGAWIPLQSNGFKYEIAEVIGNIYENPELLNG